MKPAVEATLKTTQGSYTIRPLLEQDVNAEYVGWLNDSETTKLTAIRPGEVTVASQRGYVANIIESSGSALFGLWGLGGRLLGTSGVQELDHPGLRPWMGVLIGSKEYRGCGLGKMLIWTVATMIFEKFGVRTVRADMYVSNVASYRAFIKAGFVELAVADKKPDVAVVECTRESLKSAADMAIRACQITTMGEDHQRRVLWNYES